MTSDHYLLNKQAREVLNTLQIEQPTLSRCVGVALSTGILPLIIALVLTRGGLLVNLFALLIGCALLATAGFIVFERQLSHYNEVNKIVRQEISRGRIKA